MCREIDGGQKPKTFTIASSAIPFDPEAERNKAYEKQCIPSRDRILAHATDSKSQKASRNEQADNDVQNEVAESVLAPLDHLSRLDSVPVMTTIERR
jgi:hypothetical protein